jgi:two-component system chemotaxis sensor kinase CheA
MVRDTSQKLNKKVNLETSGSQTELDKTVIERITDPLTHIVRNAIDHGIEPPEERVAAGKDAEGTVFLDAFYRGGNVIIEISDDGKGLSRHSILNKARERNLIDGDGHALTDEEVWQFIFHSGFSTAKEVTDVSGRGVGMDVVQKNIKALGGSVTITSESGLGTKFSISLPLTLAILDGMAIKVGDETYIVPLLNILESVRPQKQDINTLKNDVEVINFRGSYIPLLRLYQAFKTKGNPVKDIHEGIVVIVESENKKVALFVDDLLGVRQVVIKSLEDNYQQVKGISGATIMGDGSIAFILDLSGIIHLAASSGSYHKTMSQIQQAIPEIMNQELPSQPPIQPSTNELATQEMPS